MKPWKVFQTQAPASPRSPHSSNVLTLAVSVVISNLFLVLAEVRVTEKSSTRNPLHKVMVTVPHLVHPSLNEELLKWCDKEVDSQSSLPSLSFFWKANSCLRFMVSDVLLIFCLSQLLQSLNLSLSGFLHTTAKFH